MEVTASFTEVDIINIRGKETIFLFKKCEPYLKDTKHTYFKIYLTVKDIEELYDYIKEKGLC